MSDSVTAAIKGRAEKAQVILSVYWERSSSSLCVADEVPYARLWITHANGTCQGPESKAPKRKRAPDSDDEYAAASSDDDDFYDRCVACR